MAQRIIDLCKEAKDNTGQPAELVRVFSELADATASDADLREEAIRGEALTLSLKSLREHGKEPEFARSVFRLLANLVYESPAHQRTATQVPEDKTDASGRAFHYAGQLFRLHATHPDVVVDILNFVPNITDEDALDDFQDIAPLFVQLLTQLRDPTTITDAAERHTHMMLAHASARALAAAATQDAVAGQLVDSRVMPPVKRMCEMYADEPRVLVEWYRALANLSFSEEAAEALAESGFTDVLRDFVKKNSSNSEVSHLVALAVRVVCNMARIPKGGFGEYMELDEVIRWLFETAGSHPTEMPVTYMVGAISRYATNDNKAAFFKAKGQDKLVETIDKFQKSQHVVEQAFNAVVKLVLPRAEGDAPAAQRQRQMAAAGICHAASGALGEHIARKNAVRSIALGLLALQQENDVTRDQTARECGQQLGAALRHQVENVGAFDALCNCLMQATITEANQTLIGKTDALYGVTEGVKHWMKEPEPLASALQFLVNLVNSEANHPLALARGAEDSVLEAMRQYDKVEDIVTFCSQIVGQLGRSVKGKVELARKKAIPQLLAVLTDHKSSADTMVKALWALEQLMTSREDAGGSGAEAAGQHISAFLNGGGAQKVCDLMVSDHPANELLVAQCLRTLSCLGQAGEAMYKALQDPILPGVVEVLKNHANTPNVVLLALALLVQTSTDSGTHAFYGASKPRSVLRAVAETAAAALRSSAFKDDAVGKGPGDLGKVFTRVPRLVGNVAKSKDQQPVLYDSGVVRPLLDAVEGQMKRPDVIYPICWALSQMTDDIEVAANVVGDGAVPVAIKVMNDISPKDGEDAVRQDAVRRASALLCNLLQTGKGVEAFEGLGQAPIKTLTDRLSDNTNPDGNVEIAANVCSAFNIAANASPRVVETIASGSTPCTAAIIAALAEFVEEEDVPVEAIDALIALGKGSSIAMAAMVKADVAATCVSVLKTHKKNAEITSRALTLLALLARRSEDARTSIGKSKVLERVKQLLDQGGGEAVKPAVAVAALDLFAAACAEKHAANIDIMLNAGPDGTTVLQTAAATHRRFIGTKKAVKFGTELAYSVGSGKSSAIPTLVELGYADLTGQVMERWRDDAELQKECAQLIELLAKHNSSGADACVAAELGRQLCESAEAHDSSLAPYTYRAIAAMAWHNEATRARLQRQPVHRLLAKDVVALPNATADGLEALCLAVGNLAMDEAGRERFGEPEAFLQHLFDIGKQYGSDRKVKPMAGWAVANWAFDHEKPHGDALVDYMAETQPGIPFLESKVDDPKAPLIDPPRHKLTVEALEILRNGGRKRREEEERRRREEEERIRREKEEEERKKREAEEARLREILEMKQGYERRYQKLLGAHDDAVDTINKLNKWIKEFMGSAKERERKLKGALKTTFADLRAKERQLLLTEQLMTEVHTYSLNFGDKERLEQLENDAEYWRKKAEEAIRERDEHLRDRKEVEEGLARVAAGQRSIADEVKRMKAEKEERDAAMEKMEDEQKKLQARLIEVKAREENVDGTLTDVQRRKAQIEADEEEMHRRKMELELVQTELADEEARLEQLRERQRQLEQYYAELKEKEGEVSSAAGTIELRLTKVVEREEGVAAKELELERRRREVQQREEAVDEDEKRFDERERALEEKEDSIQEQADDLEEKLELFEADRAEFLEAKAKFDKRVAELQPQLDQLDVREAECRAKEVELSNLEEKLNDRQYKLDEQEEELTERSKALDERETDLESRELRVEKLERSIAPREAEVSRREDELRQREEMLDEVEDRQEAREAKMKEREAEIDLREMSINDREKDLVVREDELNAKLEDVAAREVNVAERADVVQSREQDCELRERRVEEDERELSARQKTLDGLAAALETKMEDIELRRKMIEAQELEMAKKQEEYELRWKECLEKEKDVANREADFRNREHSIASRETELLKSRKALDDDRAALNVLEKQLDELRRELRERERKLERDNATMLSEKEAWETKKKELEEMEENVRDKLRIAAEAEERRAKTEAWVTEQEAKIKEKYHELKERQDAVREKEVAADEKLDEAKKIAAKMKAECDERDKALVEREKDLEEGLVVLKEGQQTVEQRLQEIKEQEAELSKTRSDIADMEATIKGKLRKLEEDEEEMKKKKAQIADEEANLQANVRNRGDYESDLQAREAAMKEREGTLAQELAMKAQREAHEREKLERQFEQRLSERVQAAEARLRDNLQGQIFELEQQLQQLKSRGHFDESLLEESDEEESISHLQMTQQLAELKRRMAARREAMQKLRAYATSLKGQLEASQKEALLAQVQGDDTKLRQRVLQEQEEKVLSSVTALEKIAKRKVILADNEDPQPWEKMAAAIENVHAYILTLQGAGGASPLANSTAPSVMDASVTKELSTMRAAVSIEDREKLANSQAADGLFLNPTGLRVVKVSKTEATFVWNKSMDAPEGSAYVVYISRDKLATWTTVVKTKATKWTFNDLQAGQVYFLTVMTVSPKRPPETWKAEILSFPTKKDTWAPAEDEPPPRFKIQEHERSYLRCNDYGDNLPVKEDAEAAEVAAKEAAAAADAKAKADAAAAEELTKSQAAEAARKKAEQDKLVDEVLRG